MVSSDITDIIVAVQFTYVTQFSLTLRPHELQHRVPCPSPTPRAFSNSSPLSRWCCPAISSFVLPFFSSLQSFPASRAFTNESVLRIRWPKSWNFSFSICPSSEYSGLISFRIDWIFFFPCRPRNSQESSPRPQFKSINSLVLSFLYGPTLTPRHDYWKNHSFNQIDLCWQSMPLLFNI